MKTFLYIDGFNLYYSALKDTPLRWLNPVALAASAFPRNRIAATKFFTAKVTPLPHDPHQPDRQNAYWRALRTLPDLEIIEGDFRTRKVRAKVVQPPPNTIEVYKTEEKGSDVNLGAHLLMDGFLNRYDAAIVITGDSDLVTPIQMACRELRKPVGVSIPSGSPAPDAVPNARARDCRKPPPSTKTASLGTSSSRHSSRIPSPTPTAPFTNPPLGKRPSSFQHLSFSASQILSFYLAMPAKKSAKYPTAKEVATLKHAEAKRKNIPTAEHQSVLKNEDQNPVRVAYPRNTDLDPQLVWRGKDEQDWSDLVVHAPPLYIQEKVHPKALIDDLLRQTRDKEHDLGNLTPDLFADFNGIPKGADKTEFYQHDQNWSNRMILGDSLQVMASLVEREGLRGKVQCLYFDPPYGIKFNSNFQWSTTSRDVKDGNAAHITREPEQVKAFRDTWRDGIHSYLTYLRDRLIVGRDLLTDSGSIFVQIGDENVHRVRAVMDEVFGDENQVSMITLNKTATPSGGRL